MPGDMKNAETGTAGFDFDRCFAGEEPVDLKRLERHGPTDCLLENGFECEVRIRIRMRPHRAIVRPFQRGHIGDMVVVEVGEEKKIEPVFT